MHINGRTAAIAITAIVAALIAGFVIGTATSTNNTTNFKNASSGPSVLGCAPAPSKCGLPDTTNTGLQPGVVLTKVPSEATKGTGWSYASNKVTVTASNVTINGLDLADGVTLSVPDGRSNVVLDNLRVNGAHGQNNNAVTIGALTTNTRLTNCELIGAPLSEGFSSSRKGQAGVLTLNTSQGANGVTVDHCNIHGFSSGIYFQTDNGDNVVTNNYIHGMTCWNWTANVSCLTNQGAGIDHLNNLQFGGGPGTSTHPATALVRNNTLINDGLCCQSDAIALFDDSGSHQHAAQRPHEDRRQPDRERWRVLHQR